MARMKAPLDSNIIGAEENLLIDCQILLHSLIVDRGISRTDLAERAGMSKARLSQIMSPEANPTLKTMARLFHALGEQMTVGVNSEKRADIAPRVEPLADVWTEAHDVSISVEDAALVALVKQSVAKGVANDNHASVVIMESEFMMTLEAA